MAIEKTEFRFIEANEITGTSEKTGKAYHLRKIHFADPLTFENHTLDYKEGLNLSPFSKGEPVHLEFELAAGYGNRDSRTIVTKVFPAKQ